MNRLLERTQYSVSTIEFKTAQGVSCGASVRWSPTPQQLLKRPKEAFRAACGTWEEVYEVVESWATQHAQLE